MYTSALEYEVGGDEGYLFHPVTGGVDRVMEGAFSQPHHLTLYLHSGTRCYLAQGPSGRSTSSA